MLFNLSIDSCLLDKDCSYFGYPTGLVFLHLQVAGKNPFSIRIKSETLCILDTKYMHIRPVQIGFETKEIYSRVKPIGNRREYVKNEKKQKFHSIRVREVGGREVLRAKIGSSQFSAKLQVP